MFGGFLLGVITPREHLVALRITERVEVCGHNQSL